MSSVVQADSVGIIVPRADFRAMAHSVFHNAANLRVEGMEILLVLFASDDIELPQGIRVPDARAVRQLAPGRALACRGGLLGGAGLAGGGDLPDGRELPYAVDLHSARRYDGAIRARGGEADAAAFQTVRALLARRQAEKQSDLRVEDLSGGAGVASAPHPAVLGLRALASAARAGDLTAAEQAVGALVGLGGGLTPAGDDALVGFLAGLRAAQSPLIAQMSDLVRVASARTNDISRSYLLLAAEGQFSSALASLASALQDGEAGERLLAAAEAAFQVGHTSGMDAATGLLAAGI